MENLLWEKSLVIYPTVNERFWDVELGAWCKQRRNVALGESVDLSQERLWND